MSSREAVISQVRDALEAVVDPCSIATGVPITIGDMGLIDAIEEDDGDVRVVLRLTSPFCWQATNIIEAVERAANQVAAVRSARCEINASAEWTPDLMAKRAQARLRRARPLAVS
jgi:metal-sulfur cluster biosynthetic enzyme